MVLELLISPLKAERKPWELFFIGIIYSSAGLILGRLVFPEHAGIAMVFLTTLAGAYLVQRILNLEELGGSKSEFSRLKHHAKALSVFMFLFFGFLVSFAFWYVAMPAETTHSVYAPQEKTIDCINSAGIQGCATGNPALLKIIYNNVRVLGVTLLFAFFYGAGAVFILAWNAAIIGTAVGILVRNGLGNVAGNLGLSGMASYFGLFSAGILRYMTHGVFEILAYFIAALAGGIISIAVVKHDLVSPEFRKTAFDALNLTAISVGLILLGAVIEVFVTPLLFY